jgi:ABC-type lipoprotein release transport system permease subunit
MYSEGTLLEFTKIPELDQDLFYKFSVDNIMFFLRKEQEIKENNWYKKASEESKLSISTKFLYFNNKLLDMWDRPIDGCAFFVEGQKWCYEDYINDYMWISNSCSKEQNIKIGDSIKYYIDNNKYISVTVRGIFDKKIAENGGYTMDCILPISLGAKIGKMKDIAISYNAIGTLQNVTQYQSLLKYCNENGFGISGAGDQALSLINTASMINITCLVVAFLLIVCSVGVVFILLSIIMKLRERHIAISRAIGISILKISFVYMLVIEAITTVSIFISQFISNHLNRVLETNLIKILEIDSFYLRSSINTLFIVLITTNILFIFFFILLAKKMSKLNIIVLLGRG